MFYPSHSPENSGLALIFDMDGVIVDSNPAHREAWTAFNRRYGLETTEDMHQRMYGRRNDQIVRDFFGESLPEHEVMARGAAKEELYREMVAAGVDTMLVPGIREFLDRNASLPMALATNGERANVDFLLEKAALQSRFSIVIDGLQVQHPKPHPEIYLLAAGHLGVAPANCIVFEDSYTGVGAALAAGMRVVGIRTTHDNLPGTSITIDNFRSGELTSWLAAQTRV